MDRDDLILRGIADGATSPAALEERTGLAHATVWRGLHRLVVSGHVFSPARSAYRLSALGETALALAGQDSATPGPADTALDVEPRSISAIDISVLEAQLAHPIERGADMDHHDADRQARLDVTGHAAVAGTFGWGEVVALIVGVLIGVVVAFLASRRAAVPPPVGPDAPPQPAAFTPPWGSWQ